ncbi:MAG: DNA-binding response regulator [Verrucomicrobiales bacterium]|nr:DNA-binding response regulator [Verrucomicrobiales bacterium]
MNPTVTKWRVLLVDDHPLLRNAITSLLNAENDFSVCGEADDIETSLRLIATLKPEIVILDLTLRSGDGLESLHRIKEQFPKTKVLVFSGRDESIYALRVVRAGALGFVRKEESVEKLLLALRMVANGIVYLSEEVEAQLLNAPDADKIPLPQSPVASLTDRELQIFTLYGRGNGTSQIAERLGLSIKTVEAHRTNIKEKMNIKSAAEFLRRAIEWMSGDDGRNPDVKSPH